MKFKKRNVKGAFSNGSCSECNKGCLSKNKLGLDFPYDKIIEVEVGNMVFRLCEECFNKLMSVRWEDVPQLANEIDTNGIEL